MERYVDKKGNVLFGSPDDIQYRDNMLKNQNQELRDEVNEDSYNEIES